MDVREMKTISKNKGRAGKKPGFLGSALAQVFLVEADETARQVIGEIRTMKERLAELCSLPEKEHIEFRATMEAKRDDFKAIAKKENLSLDNYFKAHDEGRIAASVTATVSLWQKLSVAAQKGWKPDYSIGWADISKKATEFNNSQGARGKAVKELTATEKQAEVTKKAAGVVTRVKALAKAALTDASGNKAEHFASALPDAVATMCQLATVEELDSVIAKLQDMRKNKLEQRETAAKIIANAKDGKPASKPRKGAPGRTVEPEHATASAGKRSRK